MVKEYKRLDSITCPLAGCNIIEASAGTGKTYNIENLYARLVLQKGFSVDSILVVTFTEAATKELKERIRSMLHEVQAFLEGNENVEDRVKEIVDLSAEPDKSSMQRCISSALINFDEAAIYTIHGFCNKILNDNSFESGILFNTELETNPDHIVQDIVEDFWRSKFYTADEFTSMLINYKKLSIKQLVTFVKEFISKEEVIIMPQEIPKCNLANIKNEFYRLLDTWNRNEVEDILNNTPLKKNSYKKEQISSACDAIDMLKSGVFAKETISALTKLSEEKINSSILKAHKNSNKLTHPFFKASSQFLKANDEIDLFDVTIKLECKNYFNKKYAKRKSALNIQTFDDLLKKTASQISHDNNLLLKAIREQFKAALIDEFQDTDPVQYHIFKKIFIDAETPIFMVGDPKQAIYAFRGGDIFTYQLAKENMANKNNGNFYTLEKNWRSSPSIVSAVNSLFAPNNKNEYPFVSRDIQLIEAHGDEKNNKLKINGTPESKPLKIILHSSNPGFTAQSLRNACYERTASEIYDLLTDKNITISDNPQTIMPKDIAILVTTHEQARSLQPHLQKLNIPSVIQCTGSVFDSTEAKHLGYFLSAVAEPKNLNAVRGAMVTDLMNYSASQIAGTADNQNNFEEILESFKNYHTKWLNNSFIEMFNSFMADYHVKSTLLQQIAGERKLTNILHLAELLHKQETECKLGINGLVHWLLKQSSEKTTTGKDEYKIRLESDNDAVQIMTIHKAKGLEFPIVFCPFMWNSTADSNRNYNISKYHKNNDEFVIDISDNENAKNKSNDEELEELLRLFYVAITRAKYQCYLMWGNVNKKNTSPLDYLFFADKSVTTQPKGGKAAQLSTISKTAKKENFKVNLTPQQHQNIELITNEKHIPDDAKYTLEKVRSNKIDYLKFPNNIIDPNWKIISFSSIAPHASPTSPEITKDHDETDNIVDETSLTRDTSINIYNFPAGAKTGTCWHEIFEELDFTTNDEEIKKAVIKKLNIYNLGDDDSEKQNVVFTMVKNVLNKTLPECNTSLGKIKPHDKIPEMEFNFSLNGSLNTKDVSSAIKDFSKNFGFDNGIQNWQQIISDGFMTGFIDLIFRHNDKYYIIDWKSNKLEGTPESFNAKGVKKEMAKHYYFLQYLIYTVALDKYLSTRIKNYDYEKHFGGIYYIFLRGIKNDGIFYDRPNKKLITKLSNTIGGT